MAPGSRDTQQAEKTGEKRKGEQKVADPDLGVKRPKTARCLTTELEAARKTLSAVLVQAAVQEDVADRTLDSGIVSVMRQRMDIGVSFLGVRLHLVAPPDVQVTDVAPTCDLQNMAYATQVLLVGTCPQAC